MPAVWGLGRVVHDAHFTAQPPRGLAYAGSRGGGSVWNALATISAEYRYPTGGIGVAGDDARADVAIADNTALGIDMTRIHRVAATATVTMHNYPIPAENGNGNGWEYLTRPRCPACGGVPATAPLEANREILSGPEQFGLPAAVLVVDKLTVTTVRWARWLRARGWTTVIDIGYPGYLYPRSAEVLGSQLDCFDVIVMQATVARFLARRRGFDAAGMAALGRGLVVISDGARGLRALDGRDEHTVRFEIPAPDCEVLDPVGAGDAFLGGLIAAMLGSGHRHGPIRADPDTVRHWCTHAVAALPVALGAVGPRGHLPGVVSMLPAAESDAGGCGICGSRPAPPTPDGG
ncbi:sugar/nucleoside kinase (ribokinase family) [Nocardia sp. GAS34]|uniref:carbohydrate kinase family protein n=1 Tax=unclassified Nocardia TaxID=2637762 RepID=UPI003D20E1AA